MPRIDLKFFQKALVYCDPSDRSARFGGGFSWKHLFTAATNIASAVSAIHEQGYCVGDLNESNILIAPSALVSLIDCDSFQVPDPESGGVHRCAVGKPEYTAPELMGKRYDEVDRTIASDSFAFAVLAFQLLMEGTHPYQAKGKLVEDAANTEAKIRLGHFPYGVRRRDISPPDHAPPYDILPPEMQKFFNRSFAVGHGEPSHRPTPREWYELFRRLENQFQQCQINSNHLFLGHLHSCPWCEIRATRGRDPFLSPVGQQIALDDGTLQLESLEKRIEYLQPYVVMAFADGVLTTEEKNYLNALGSRLQVPVKEVDKLIQAEAKRVKGKLGSSPGNPQLEVSQTAFQFENIRRGTQVSGRYVIANIGGGSLQGAIRSSHKWLKVSQSLIDTSRHRQEHEFVVETSQLGLGSQNWGSIEIDSNGGNARLQISISIEIEKSALSRFGRTLFWIGALVGGVFGYVLYKILPDMPSRNIVSGIAGLIGLVGAIVVGSRTGGFAGGCGTFIIGSIVLGVLQSAWPVAYSILAWATTFGSLLHTSARPLFVSKHAGKIGAAVGVAAGAIGLSAAIILAGLGIGSTLAPSSHLNALPLEDKLIGSSVGSPTGIRWTHALGDRGALFSAADSSRIEYPGLIPPEGTLEFWIKVNDGYHYENSQFKANQNDAMVFSSDVQGGDVTWPGTTKLFVGRDGHLLYFMATSKYNKPPAQATEARRTKFRFGEWHAIGVSYGKQGQYIMLDGKLVASAPTRTQTFGVAGNHQQPLDIPTIGETVSHFWSPHRYEGGFEGTLGAFRISATQQDWSLAKGIKDSSATGGVATGAQLTPVGYVNDYAHVLDQNALERMEEICQQIDQKAHAQVAIVIVRSLDGSEIERYAVDLFKKWGIGSKSTNRGVLILYAIDDRRSRIEVGDGLEAILPDSKVADFQKEAVPLMQSGDYGQALLLVTSRVSDIVANDAGVQLKIPSKGLSTDESTRPNSMEISNGESAQPPAVVRSELGQYSLRLSQNQQAAVSLFLSTHGDFQMADCQTLGYAAAACDEAYTEWKGLVQNAKAEVQYPYAAWGDFNQDGLLDFVIPFFGRMPVNNWGWRNWYVVVFQGTRDGHFTPVIAAEDKWGACFDGMLYHPVRKQIEYWCKSAGGSFRWDGSQYVAQRLIGD